MFHKVDGQQRPLFSKGKSSSYCPQKVISLALEQRTELCPKHLVLRNLSRETRKEAKKNKKKICSLNARVLRKLALCEAGNPSPAVFCHDVFESV